MLSSHPTQTANNYKWFAKVDMDTYVNCFQLKKLFAALKPFEERQQYVGRPFRGRAEEAEKLGLYGRSYCSGERDRMEAVKKKRR